MQGERSLGRKLFFAKWSIYFIGLLIMAFGIVLMIRANLGSAPWDVFHIGLFYQIGLTIGTWSIIVGFFILMISSIISKKLPQIGAFLNMLMVGIFIDLYLMVPQLHTPDTIMGKIAMLVLGIMIIGIGIGVYISSRCGAGPRDSLMISLTQVTGWKVQYIRLGMELVVLCLGWLLGGPIFIGTILFSLTIGSIVGLTLPACQKATDLILYKIQHRNDKKVTLQI
ncbi:YczE/YyaS/YitT family protein [Sutcliffiella horikoshii]|uniref:YczE/YyaS/YitT family protein n=1 Tax=Sutcliffiella horikoshii TaxID=79883 RepID=UPI001F15ADEE|nr:YitT family protein [Sutcliffiella horikoshii]MCG1022245.1 YitT family protein [Sutcliffiella horikoshii]